MDFGASPIRPGGGTSAPVGRRDPRLNPRSDVGQVFFIGADGRAVARNIFLDGNTCEPSWKQWGQPASFHGESNHENSRHHDDHQGYWNR
jgi:hypothetical protein